MNGPGPAPTGPVTGGSRLRLASVTGMSLVACGLILGCGGEPTPKPRLPVATIWSGAALSGPQREQSLLASRAIRGAIHDLRSLARGRYQVRYVALDDSSRAAAGWDPAVVAANARRAAVANSTMAYIGESDSGATAVALPILNQSGVLQLTASSTAEGLTRTGLGAGPGAPFQYYPSGKRTLVRLVPRDSLQGALIAALAKGGGCRSMAIIDDGSIYGAGLTEIVATEAVARRIRVTFAGTVEPRADSYRQSLRRARASCLLYAGDAGPDAVRVVTDAARRNPRAKVYGPDSLVNPTFVDPGRGGIGPGLARRVRLIGAIGPPSSLPPFGRWLSDRLGARASDMRAPSVASSYAAAELVLRCLRRTFDRTGFESRRADDSRRSMVSCAVGRRHRSAAIGRYRVLPTGDSSLRSYSLFRIDRGRIVLDRALRPPRLVAAPEPMADTNR